MRQKDPIPMNASILKKVAMAVTGLAWFGFLLSHLSGNLLLFRGAETFNAYAEFLESLGGLLYIAEVALILFLAIHVFSGIRVTIENRRARPVAYRQNRSAGASSVGSRTMIVGGVILAVFIVIHVKSFKFSDHHGPMGLYGVVNAAFADPLTVAGYVLAMLALGLHLSHGLSSAFQSLGLVKPAWREKLRTMGTALGWLIACGFISMPLGLFWLGRR